MSRVDVEIRQPGHHGQLWDVAALDPCLGLIDVVLRTDHDRRDVEAPVVAESDETRGDPSGHGHGQDVQGSQKLDARIPVQILDEVVAEGWASPERIERFRQILLRSGLIAITRKTRGEDIDAACGQLAGQVKDRTRVRLGSKLAQVAIRS